MSSLTELHQKAMELAEQAFIAKRHGNISLAQTYFQQALQHERQAADLLRNHLDAEPTRSVLYRSAATLAFECGDDREAEKLIGLGLSGDLPFEIADELRALLENVNFSRHLKLSGIQLEPNEIQMAVTGHGVGHGLARSDLIIGRLTNLEKLIYRTADRKSNVPFQDASTPLTSRSLPVYWSAPRPSSFSITIRIGKSEQPSLPGFDHPLEVINEILKCVRLINDLKENQLESEIGDSAYFNNFLGLIQKIAPDGLEVDGIGFTTVQNGQEEHTPLKRLQKSISKIPKKISDNELVEVTDSHEKNRIAITGELKYADATMPTNEIRLLDENHKQHQIVVPKGLMSDIVKPLWNEKVVVTATRNKGKYILEEIRRAE